jgi:hypothetical protein
LTVNVYNTRKIAKTYNVIGIINGETEPGIKSQILKLKKI